MYIFLFCAGVPIHITNYTKIEVLFLPDVAGGCFCSPGGLVTTCRCTYADDSLLFDSLREAVFIKSIYLSNFIGNL